MEILNKTALREAIYLIKKDIDGLQYLIASPANKGLKKHAKIKLNTYQNILSWLEACK